MTNFFIADNHFEHYNIIKYCNRPFDTKEEHDETMIANWNKVVPVRDSRVFIVGDLMFRVNHKIMNRLNGSQKILIKGNHDNLKKDDLKFFSQVLYKNSTGILDVVVNNQKITLCHYPLESWNHSFRGAWHLHGHTHGKSIGSCSESIERGLRLDVGVDNHNFTPWTFDEIKKVMEYKQNKMKELGLTQLT